MNAECIPGCRMLTEEECKIWQVEQDNSDEEIDEQWLETITREDTVVCVLGEHESQSGEAASRAFLTLPEEQQMLFEKIAKRTDNIVTVVISGRPLDLRRISEKSKAVIMAWRPGTMGAEAITDLVYGITNPLGKLFEDLCKNLKNIYMDRKPDLKKQDRVREQNPEWYKKNDILGMMMYVNAFAGNLKGVKEKLDYVQECNVNYLHLMPLLESPEGKSDGGYAVSDFRKVQPELGTMEDLESLADECRKKGISLCMDFVMNHTSEDHEWARRARAGEREYMDRYYFYDNYDVPSQFEQTVPQVFPTTAPGNFTWLDDMKKFVMTTFYPYQWDLNYWNPVVMNEMIYNMLNLTNKGIDVIRIDAVPYIWKQLGTNCRNLPQVHNIVRMMRMICEIVCPGVLLLGEVVMEPEKVVPYFGSVEKPECHMLYNVTTMATTWNTVATRDARLLRQQMDIINRLPKDYVFLNYLRCHDDIGWGLSLKIIRNKRFL